MKRITAGLIVMILLLSFSMPAFAKNDDTSIVKTKEYSSTNKNEAATFDETITKDKIKYQLKDISYEIVSSEPETTEKNITQTETYIGLTSQEVAQSIKSKDYPDIDLELSEAEYTTTDLDSTTLISGTTDYGYLTSSPTAAQSKAVEYTNQLGNTFTATINLDSVTQTEAPSWKDGFTIYAYYSGEPDSTYFAFGSTNIPNTTDGSVPYKGYEDVILNYLGLDSSVYQITSARWTGSSVSNGVTVRTAEFSCNSLTARYVANYSAEVPEQGYTATATYTAENAVVPTGETIYTIKAAATYELVEQSNNLIIPVSISIAVVVIVAVALLFLLKHRKKKRGLT